MPRQPQFGQGEGAVAPISSDVYEMYAPQMAMTDFQTDSARTAYELEKDIELEEQAQIDSSIAQSKFATDERKRGAEKEAKKAEKGRKVSAATTGATVGFQLGGPLGAARGGLGGWLFGEEGGYVPSIPPRSMLFKEYQQGGNVMGYTGEGKFLRRGLQNLQMRQDDLSRLTENVDKMGKYNFWDAAMDVGKGYMMGKNITDFGQNIMKSDFMQGIPTALEAGSEMGMSKGQSLLDYTKSFLPQKDDSMNLLNLFKGPTEQTFAPVMKDAGGLDYSQVPGMPKYNPAMTTVQKSPVRQTALGMSPFKKAFRDARKSNQKTFEHDGKMYTTELR